MYYVHQYTRTKIANVIMFDSDISSVFCDIQVAVVHERLGVEPKVVNSNLCAV